MKVLVCVRLLRLLMARWLAWVASVLVSVISSVLASVFAVAGLLIVTVPVAAQGPARDPNRYQVSGDGQEVLDTQTKLAWRRCLEGMRLEVNRCVGEPATMSWPQAQAWATSQQVAEATWRVPTMDELTTVVDMTLPGSPIDGNLFPSTPKVYIWSATPNERTPTQAWTMFNANGYLMSAWQSVPYSLRLVRSRL